MRNLKISRGYFLLLDRNPKGYELDEYTATNVKVNMRIISTLKNKNPFEA